MIFVNSRYFIYFRDSIRVLGYLKGLRRAVVVQLKGGERLAKSAMPCDMEDIALVESKEAAV
jgi:hypothetical protein